MPEQGASWAVFMEDPLSLEQCAGRLERRGFRSFVVPGLKEAAEVMLGLVREFSPSSASYGDSMTLKAAGILDDLRSNPDIQFYDGFVPGMEREEKCEIRRRGVTVQCTLLVHGMRLPLLIREPSPRQHWRRPRASAAAGGGCKARSAGGAWRARAAAWGVEFQWFSGLRQARGHQSIARSPGPSARACSRRLPRCRSAIDRAIASPRPDPPAVACEPRR